MTADEIITKADALEAGNLYEKEQKLRWLSDLDGVIHEEIVKTHDGWDGQAFTPYEDGSETLIAGQPYAENMYVYYLRSMIADSNHETVKYNQMAAQYNNAYQQFANWYNRHHMPNSVGGCNRYRF